MFASKNLSFAKAASGAYQISRSLRFRSSATAYLSRTPASAGNRQTWTWSGWVKRGTLGTAQYLFSGVSGTTEANISFTSNNTIYFLVYNSGATAGQITTAAVFRDTSAWYHVVAVLDSTNATAADRMRLYVNGVRQTLDGTAITLPPNTTGQINNNVSHYSGSYNGSLYYLDGYLAEVNFIDGQALTPSSFGAYDASTGVWGPARYTGSYGTNGFYLAYSDPSGSGNGNDTYTKLLLHGNGLNDSAWNGSSNHALTAYGSATTSTTQTKFGMSSSLYTLGSSSQYFRTDASADFKYAAASGSANDFTFDFWFYPGASGSQYPAFSIADTTYSSLINYTSSLYASSNNTSWDIANGRSLGTPTLGQWNHYAIVRSGSTWYTFLNGVQQDTWTNSSAGYDYTTNNYLQLGRIQGGSLYSTGYYAEARWSAGIARWTSAFTPPTAPYSGGSGTDSSGNVNAWRPFNINTATSGTTYDSMIDSPTPYSDGTAYGRGNYATLNPLDVNSTYFVNATFSNANLSISATSSGQYYVHPTISNNTGKFYQEFTVTSLGAGGALTNSIVVSAPGNFGAVYCAYDKSGQKYISGAWTTGWTAWAANDVIGIAVDYDVGSATYYLNGTLQGTLTFGSQGSAPLCVANNAQAGSGGTASVSFNAGQRPFSISSIPSGYSALNTQNLPTPTIKNGAQYMAAVTYEGNGGTKTVATTSSNSGNNPLGKSFQPDFVWVKCRSGVIQNILTDVVRGVSKQLCSDTTGAEVAYTNLQITAFNNDGFTAIDATNGGYGVNGSPGGTYSGSSASYIAWEWKAGGTASPIAVNAYGSTPSIASSVSANTSAGFSIATFTVPASNTFTVGHGLGAVPSMIIMKARNAAGTVNWNVYHTSLGAGNLLRLNTTVASTASTTCWANTAPTSTVFSSSGNGNFYDANDTIVAYCFSNVSGYSSAFSYTGNGSSDGPMVFLNFRPRWLIIKRTDAAANWYIFDTSRNTYNVTDISLYPNLSDAEASSTSHLLDVLSNGFKLKGTGANLNASGGSYVGYAVAENPFKYSLAR